MAVDPKGMSSVELGDLSFVSSDAAEDGMYGLMESSELDGRKQQKSTDFGIGNLTSNVLNKRGFGWLLEIEEIDEEAYEKPLLYGSEDYVIKTNLSYSSILIFSHNNCNIEWLQ